MTARPDDTDGDSRRCSAPQTPELAQPIVGDGYGDSEPPQGFCNRVGLHNRCAALPDHGWANHDAGLTAHDMPTPRTACTTPGWHHCPIGGGDMYHAWIPEDGE